MNNMFNHNHKMGFKNEPNNYFSFTNGQDYETNYPIFNNYIVNYSPNPIYDDISDDDASSDSGIATLYNYAEYPNSITNWNSDQVMKWILELYDSKGFRYEDLNLHYFKKKDGQYLISLREEDWERIDKNRSKFLYENVQQLIKESVIRRNEAQTRLSVISHSSGYSIQSSDYYSSSQSPDEEETKQQQPYVRKRGRPRSENSKRRNSQKLGRVWEFLRDLLLNPQYCPKIICWEDYPARVFRLVDGNEVARMWGEKKRNPNMNYGKFSRSIRHYYKLKVIESVSGKRYVYKFGKNAEGCETNNPNFGLNINKTS